MDDNQINKDILGMVRDFSRTRKYTNGEDRSYLQGPGVSRVERRITTWELWILS